MADFKGNLRRTERLMSEEAAKEFLQTKKVAHVGTVEKQGYAYVVPLLYIYLGGNEVYLHIGKHEGHFYNNLLNNSKACIKVEQMGDIVPGEKYACDSSMSYKSVILFGEFEIAEDESQKTWFFDKLFKKYGKRMAV